MGDDNDKDMKGYLALGVCLVFIPAVLQGIGFLSSSWASNSTCDSGITRICCLTNQTSRWNTQTNVRRCRDNENRKGILRGDIYITCTCISYPCVKIQ